MTEPLDPRRAAVEVLQSAGAKRERARRRRALQVSARDRGLFHELVSGVSRREVTLERVLDAFADRGTEDLEPVVRAALLVGLYQLLLLDRIPGHAAVNSAVSCLPRRIGNGPRRLVNGLLRAVSREVGSAEPVAAPDVILRPGLDSAVSVGRAVFPDPDRDRLGFAAAQWGFEREALEILLQDFEMDEVETIVRVAGLPPVTTVRRQARRCGEEELVTAARSEGLLLGPGDGVLHTVEGGGDLAATSVFRRGWMAVQGPFAARVAGLVAPRPGESILDLCAPPGGKSCHLAELEPRARITALARDAGGARRIRENAARLDSALTIRTASSAATVGGRWDAILLDVPCSNSGVFGRRPEARRRLDRRTLAGLRVEQVAILRAGLDLVAARPGSRVVYATCSILSSENALLVRDVLEKRPDFRVTQEVAAVPVSRDRDGGYACVIERAPGR